MNNSQKFYADMHRLIKYERAHNGNNYNSQDICKKIVLMFVNLNPNLGDLPGAIADYWLKTCTNSSDNSAKEPTEKNLDRLAAMQAFLDGTDADTDMLTIRDWEELGMIVSCEAENLPIDILTTLMKIIVDKKALN